MSKSIYDVAIIGGGHNGLTTACYLAKAGLKVVVVEKQSYVGGAAVSREIHPGWTYSNCSYVCSLLRPEIFRDLELSKYGLQIIPCLVVPYPIPISGTVFFKLLPTILGGFLFDNPKRCFIFHCLGELIRICFNLI